MIVELRTWLKLAKKVSSIFLPLYNDIFIEKFLCCKLRKKDFQIIYYLIVTLNFLQFGILVFKTDKIIASEELLVASKIVFFCLRRGSGFKMQ